MLAGGYGESGAAGAAEAMSRASGVVPPLWRYTRHPGYLGDACLISRRPVAGRADMLSPGCSPMD